MKKARSPWRPSPPLPSAPTPRTSPMASPSPSSCPSPPAARPTAWRATWPKPCASRWTASASSCRQRRRRRQHHRQRQGGARQARRLHAAAHARRHGDHARAVPQAALQLRDRLRVPGHDQRRAHDRHRQAAAGSQQLQGTARLDRQERRQGQPGQCRHRLGLAPVRPAVPERAEGRDDHRAVQGHRAGDRRPDRRPDRPAVRPDHQHHARRSRPRRSRPTP